MTQTPMFLIVGVCMLLLGTALVVGALHSLKAQLLPFRNDLRAWMGRFRAQFPLRFVLWGIGQAVRVIGFVVMFWGDSIFGP